MIKSHPTNLNKVILIDKRSGNNIEKSIAAVTSLLRTSTDKIEVYDKGVENWINETI